MSVMTVPDPKAAYRLSAVSPARSLLPLKRHSAACSRRGAQLNSVTCYWLVIKPLLAAWIAFIPYGLATVVMDLAATRSWSAEFAAGAFWLAVMVFWPNPKLKTNPVPVPKRATRRYSPPVVLDPAPARPRAAVAIVRQRVAFLLVASDGIPVSPSGV